MGRNQKGAARRVALLGVLFALAAVLSLFEGALAGAMGLPPAACLAVLKALLALLTRGAVAGALSLCGGLFSVGVMWLLRRFGKPTPFILSASGALAHNAGQLAVFAALWGTRGARALVWYAPVLAVSGLVMGALTALALRALVPAMKKAGFSDIINNFYQ